MGRLKKIIYICLAMVLCFTAAAPSVHAAGIDIDRDCTLTIQYANSGRTCEGVQVKTYRITSVDAEGECTLCDAFSDYDVELDGINSQENWKDVAGTLAAYAEADKIKAIRTARTDGNGIVRFTGLKPGVYLNVAGKAVLGAERIIFENFLTVIPHQDNDGNYNYNVTAYPKSDSYIPEPGNVVYKVVKHWKDSADKNNRPDRIRIEIIKDGAHDSYQTLSADNNWTYIWETADDGSTWQVVERDKPAGYKVKIEKKGRTLIITNSLIEKTPPGKGDGDTPQTGDTTSIWPYVGVMCFAGAVMLLFAIWRKREE